MNTTNNDFESIYSGQDILVTGGCGYIGKEIVRQLLKYNPKRIMIFDQNEAGLFQMSQDFKKHKNLRYLVGNIRDKSRLKHAMEDAKIVFHAAALKHVPLCEYNPHEAVMTNVFGTQNIIEAAREMNVERVIGISTDKAVNPVNTMGATKLLSEKLFMRANSGENTTKFSCVRFGNVLNSIGSVIPIFKEQISKGDKVTITSLEMTRFFMTVEDAVNLVLRTSAIMNSEEIIILKMDSLRIIDLAEVMIEELAPKYGYKPEDIKIEVIGARPGEKTHEALISEEEFLYTRELEDIYLLRTNLTDKTNNNDFAREKVYNSKTSKILNKEEIKMILYEKNII